MFYSNWEKENNLKKYLTKVNISGNIEKSGIPVIYDGYDCYITNNNAHSLVVGATGSGKTQSIILPLIKLSMEAEESIIINDVKGELYKSTSCEFKKRGYNVLLLDFDDSIYGNYWNPLKFPYTLYKEGRFDKALNVVEGLGYYLFSDKEANDSDPFWVNSCIDYFTGLCLYLIKNRDEEVNLKEVFNLANELSIQNKSDEFLKEIGKDNSIYYNVAGTLESPNETKGGIIATFNQKIKKFISRENLSRMISKSDFDLNNISKEKTVMYIVSGYYDYSNNLIPLFINQVFEAINIYGNNKKNLNIILDEFDRLVPIKNFTEIINYSRSLHITFTVVIKSYIDLINTYGKDNIELIKLCFPNIIYLYANDIYTLEEISKLCGNINDGNKRGPLISIEELKSFKPFETIFLLPRMMPYRGKLVPDYKISWPFESEEAEYQLRK